MSYRMDYEIRRDPELLDSTGFIEIGPGKYAGLHWQPGFVFVWEDAFGMAEGILMKHFPTYDHFAVNEVPRPVGRAIIAEWRAVAARMPEISGAEVAELLQLRDVYRADLSTRVEADRDAIAGLLSGLADACDQFYEHSEWICILGM